MICPVGLWRERREPNATATTQLRYVARPKKGCWEQRKRVKVLARKKQRGARYRDKGRWSRQIIPHIGQGLLSNPHPEVQGCNLMPGWNLQGKKPPPNNER